MDEKAIKIVKDYILEHLDKSDVTPDFEVFTVWKVKALQNWKYLLSSTLFDGMYYELTYNGDKVEISEPQPYVSGNPYCQASAVILEDQPEKYKEIVEEAYEEFHERIQSIRP